MSTEEDDFLDFEFGNEIVVVQQGGIMVPEYKGPYIYVPSDVNQVIMTNGFKMSDNIEITSVPYSEVSNASNGYTATIG